MFYATNQSCPAFPSSSWNKSRQSDQTVFSERLLVWGPEARCITAPGSIRCSLVLNSSHGSHLLFPVQVQGEISSLLKAIKNIHRSTNLSWDSEGKWGAVTGEKEGRQVENLFGVIAIICRNFGLGRGEYERQHECLSSVWSSTQEGRRNTAKSRENHQNCRSANKIFIAFVG